MSTQNERVARLEPVVAPGSVEEVRARLRGCRLCVEAGYRADGPPLHRNGPLPAPIFVLGQAPAAVHAANPRTPAFSPGRHGQPSPLWSWLAEAGWPEAEFRRTAFMTAITRCYPGPAPSGSGDRRPSAYEQRLCRPFWQTELAAANPEIIITLGTMALHALGFRGARLREAVGRTYELQLVGAAGERNIPVLPLPHPSGVSRWLTAAAHRAQLDQALALLAERTAHLNGAAPAATSEGSADPPEALPC